MAAKQNRMVRDVHRDMPAWLPSIYIQMARDVRGSSYWQAYICVANEPYIVRPRYTRQLARRSNAAGEHDEYAARAAVGSDLD